MDSNRINDFINSFKTDEKEVFLHLEEYAKENSVPIIREDVKCFMRMLLKIKCPKNILEIGTAIAYSSLVMADVNKDIKIDTIEDYEPRIKIAKENIEKYDKNNQINLIQGDAGEIIPKLVLENRKYDFIFLDGPKGQYFNWLPNILKLLNDNAILLSDNVFKDGEILESRFSIEKRDRSIHYRMRDYLFELTHSKNLHTTILNMGDGISISIYKE